MIDLSFYTPDAVNESMLTGSDVEAGAAAAAVAVNGRPPLAVIISPTHSHTQSQTHRQSHTVTQSHTDTQSLMAAPFITLQLSIAAPTKLKLKGPLG